MLKLLHIALAYVTVAGFLLRGFWAITGSPLKSARVVKIAPHVVDTLLLVLGVVMALQIGYSLTDGWLGAKLLALVGYIGFGVVTLRATAKPVQIGAFLAALACVGYIFAVALTRSPWPLAAA